jgi:hypothetical protein
MLYLAFTALIRESLNLSLKDTLFITITVDLVNLFVLLNLCSGCLP